MQLGKRLWKIASLLTALTLLLSSGPACDATRFPMASAEEISMPELSIDAYAEPVALVEPGEITLHFTLSNQSEETLQNVALTSADGLVKDYLEDIAPGGEQSCSRTHSVSQSELDGGSVHYVVTCTTDSGLFSYPVAVEIQQTVAEPEVEFQRSLSSAYVANGDTVVVVYTIKNVGNIDAHALTITDPLGEFSVQLDTLPMGETRTFLNRVFPTDGVVSAPVLTFATGSARENTYSTRLDEILISTAINLLNVEFSVAESMLGAESTDVALELTNGGNVDYRSVTIYDDIYGGVIVDSLFLPAGGEPVVCSHSYPLRGTETYRWRITGVNEANERIDFLTETLEFSAAEPASAPSLSLSAEAAMTRISRPGYVMFTLTLNNHGGTAATHVRISEATLGDVYELAIVPAGDPTQFEVRYPVRADSVFAFSALYTNDNGMQHIVSAEPIEITLAANGQRPEPFEDSNSLLSGMSMQIGESPLFAILLATSCAVLVTLTIVLLVTSRRARKLRREKAAARKQRLKEEMGKTNRFKPVKRSNAKK